LIFNSNGSICTFSEEDTTNIARVAGKFVYPGLTICLSGDLGAGKTVFVRGLCETLKADGVRSPSFTLVNEYHGVMPVAHADLYRLDPGDEFDLDLESYLEDGFLLVIEWAEKLAVLPEEDLWSIRISREGAYDSDDFQKSRLFSLYAKGKKAVVQLGKYLETMKKESTSR
jgi:tRNA threonylcarbamoyladenosine biosynthesis protein TsaE